MAEISIETVGEMADFDEEPILGGKLMKILSWLSVFSAAGTGQSLSHESETTRWVIDPLSHPVLDTMSERELGDVPFRLTARRTDYETGAARVGCG